MSSITTSELICNRIEQTNTGLWGIAKVAIWRDKNPNILRKVACGAGMLACGLVGIVDAIVSISLGILSYPLNYFDYAFSNALYKRALFGGFVSGIALTISQYDNLSEAKLFDKIKKRLPFT